MGRVRRAARVDENQAALVAIIRAHGATWQSTSQISGALDGIVGYCGIDQRVEIKNPENVPSKQKLTDEEQGVFDEWKGRKPVVLKTQDDVIRLMWKLRQESLGRNS